MSARHNELENSGAGARFGSSRHTIRSEDAPLVTGRGRFTDDLVVPGQAYAAFVRASVAHAPPPPCRASSR